jgi:hypothetical protein
LKRIRAAPKITMEQQSGTIGTDADPGNVSDRAPKCAIVRGVLTESSEAYELSNVVETAPAKALICAFSAAQSAQRCAECSRGTRRYAAIA